MIDRIPACSGHTLPELLAMLGIAAVLAAAAVPVFSNLLLESRMNATVATALHAVNLARQFSATRSEAVSLCGIDAAGGCSGPATPPLESCDPGFRGRHGLRDARDAHDLRPARRSRRARRHREPQRSTAQQHA
jgi:hypothetical protein